MSNRISAAKYQATVREDVIHAGIITYLRMEMPDCLVLHPANGGGRDKREAAKLKWLGVLPGIPDIIILRPGGRFCLMEVKGPKGILSEAQNAVRYHCERYEMPWALVRSVDDARAALASWGLVTREAA